MKGWTLIQSEPKPYCPDCGGRMVLRMPKRGQNWKAFWGCSQFPNCRGKRQIDFETGKPQTDEDIEERESLEVTTSMPYIINIENTTDKLIENVFLFFTNNQNEKQFKKD